MRRSSRARSRAPCAARQPSARRRPHGMPPRPWRVGPACRASSRTATADTIVVQLLSAGAERGAKRSRTHSSPLPALAACTSGRMPRCARSKVCRPAWACCAAPCPESSISSKTASRYRVDVVGGQKTGFYLDQRDNRALVARARTRPPRAECVLLHGRLHARRAGRRRRARCASIDSSADALALARAQRSRSNPALDAQSRASGSRRDVFSELRELRNRGAAFDLIVLDPPKFAPDGGARAARGARVQGHQPARAQAARARRTARDVLVLGRRSTPTLFQKIVAGAAARRRARMPRSSGGSAPAPTIRWRWRFPKAITSRDFSSARRSAGRARSARRAQRRCGRPKNKAATGAAL